VRSHIRAEIPDLSSDQLIPEAWLDYATAVQRPNLPPTHPVHRTRRIAVDFGEGVGRDSTAILVRDDHGIIDFISGRLLSLADAAAEVARLNCIWAVLHERIRNEGVGIGGDFFNYLAKHGLKDVVRYVGAGRPREPQRLTNLRSEANWRFRDRLNPDRHTDNQYSNTSRQVPFHVSPRAWWALLREDLEALTYDLVGNQTRLMKKDDLLVRLGRSPDRGDALSQKALRSNQQGVTTVISTLLLTLAMVGSGDPTPQLTSPLPGTGMSTSYPFY